MKKSKAPVQTPNIAGKQYTLFHTGPFPDAPTTPFEGRDEFLIKLQAVQEAAQLERIRGLSVCRHCGEMMMLGEYTKDNWLWSYSYQHMIEHHNEKPSDEFIAYVETTAQNLNEA